MKCHSRPTGLLQEKDIHVHTGPPQSLFLEIFPQVLVFRCRIFWNKVGEACVQVDLGWTLPIFYPSLALAAFVDFAASFKDACFPVLLIGTAFFADSLLDFASMKMAVTCL